MSKLRFKYGPMSSQKTANLILFAYNLSEKNIPYMCLRPNSSNEQSIDKIKSRAGLEIEAVTIYPGHNIYDSIMEILPDTWEQERITEVIQYLLIDEAQFLSKTQVNELTNIVDTLGINVVCWGLRTDFQTNLFEGSKRLFEVADTLDEMVTICDCGAKATINARLDSLGKIFLSGQQIEMEGGEIHYQSMCRKCFKKYSKN
jgi:thymidine kinase